MNTTFLFYNSWWRNFVLALISAPLALGSMLPDLSGRHHDKWSFIGSIMFGFGAIFFGFRFLDRRVKVKVDAAGVQDYRKDYGLIPWSEISDYRLWSVKGNDYITLNLRSPEAWLARANTFVRMVSRFTGVQKFSVNVSLQNMAVNEASLTEFMNEMLSNAKSGAQQGAAAGVETATRFLRG